MELKNYQRNVMSDLSSYIDVIDRTDNLSEGWKKYWEEKDINVGLGGVPPYQNRLPGTPHVCMKVPTGGGKTFMACCAVKTICDHLPPEKPKVVVWLVPSDSILTQTIRTLSDVNHPYRQRLDRDFAGRVGVYTKDMLLNGQNFSPDTVQDMLTVCVMSYASLRIDSKKKDVRKVYQENGNLFRFADYFDDKSVLLADTPETALIQVLRYLSPVTIVDESHNAGSKLSTEMLENLNPSFVLELTATPRNTSNIISYVDARELKKENMVKLPVVVFNRTNRQTVIQDAIQLRGNLEKKAIEEQKAGGKYIRPIVLFQAQPRIKEDSGTFDKVKDLLLKMGIPSDQIAVKTADVDDIKDTDLMSSDCPIRFIITVNALKEGWDCPFAYILASLANKTSKVDVEQILGRILRQPYTRQHGSPLLNTSYVLTSSNDFQVTLDSVVKALNDAGFSRKDYRVADEMPTPQEEQHKNEPEQESFVAPEQDNVDTGVDDAQEESDDFTDVHPEEVQTVIQTDVSNDTSNQSDRDNTDLFSMLNQAEKQAKEYEKDINVTAGNGTISGELGEMLNQNRIQEQYRDEVKNLKIPQFFVEGDADLFGDAYDLLEPENLSDGFSLAGQDAQVSFELSAGEMYNVDIQEQGEAVPKYRRVSRKNIELLQRYMASIPKESRKRACISAIVDQINKNNRYSTSEVSDYVQRVIANMSADDLELMQTNIPTYAFKIQQKIDGLEEVYRAHQFQRWIDTGKIICRENYTLPEVITPAETIDSIPYSLYEAEKNDMNTFEREVINAIVGTDNIRWWHRIIDRKGFRLNGYFNHYPDFMVMTLSGKLILVESKGDYLANDNSKAKLDLGRKWQSLSGPKYRYFMVFKNKDVNLDGAYTLDQFIGLLKDM